MTIYTTETLTEIIGEMSTTFEAITALKEEALVQAAIGAWTKNMPLDRKSIFGMVFCMGEKLQDAEEDYLEKVIKALARTLNLLQEVGVDCSLPGDQYSAETLAAIEVFLKAGEALRSLAKKDMKEPQP